MGNFGEVIVGRIGCFKSDTIFLPAISDIASQTGNRRGEGGGGEGHKTSTTPHSGASYTHVLISREHISLYILYNDEVSFHTGLYLFLIVGYVALIFVLPGDV